MFKEIKSRRLALLVALGLSAGTMFAPNAYAQDVTITTDPPSGLPMNTDNGSGGRAGYAITDVSSSADVKENTLTLSGVGYTLGGDLYGGYTAGSGTVSGNRLTINAGNDVHGNPKEVQGRSFGGYSERGAATGNTVTIQSGDVTTVLGGEARGVGKEASHNTVNISGGVVHGDVYGGRSVSGEATHNTVNIGDGTNALTDDEIFGKIIGGSSTGAADKVTGNTLNIKTNVTAVNIENFETINFHIGSTVNYDNPMLTLNGSAQTDMKLGSVKLVSERDGATKLMRNVDGFHLTDVSAGAAPLNVRSVTDTHESYILAENPISGRYKEISHYRWQFKDVKDKVVSTGQTTPADVFGGYSGIGNMTTENKVTITGGNHDGIYGGFTTGAGTTATDEARKNHSKDNTVTIAQTAGQITSVYGGYAESLAGNAVGNKVFINGGQMSGSVYGGYSSHADATENEVTVTGGTMTDVYGGHTANPTGKATGNIVNLGDGTQELAAGTTIRDIYGGHGAGTDLTTGNTLNVKASATVHNIFNFDKINFYFDQGKNLNPTLTLNGATQTTIKSLSGISLTGTPTNRTGTLIENTAGITISDTYTGRVGKTYEKSESIVDINTPGTPLSATKIIYESNTFSGARTLTKDVTDTWGGRSILGNTTSDNIVTVDKGTHTNIYGGWTSGTGSDAAADKRNQSKGNRLTIEDSGDTLDPLTIQAGANIYGGYVNTPAGGDVTDNHVTIKDGTANGVVIKGGMTTDGVAEKNIVNISNATVGTGTNAVVTGGQGTSAIDNEVHLTEARVNGSVTAGQGTTTNGNKVYLDGGSSDTIVSGTITGGTATNGTGNMLSVKGKNRAGNIAGFQHVTFDATGVAANEKMLDITGSSATSVNWDTLSASGTAANKITLLHNSNGINLANYTEGAVKSALSEDGTSERNVEVQKTGSTITDITYQGYRFKSATNETVDGTDVYGGRSKAGNTTTRNVITVSSGNHTNAYGGWTTGTGSTAAAADRSDSKSNEITVNGTATVSGTLYGGFTSVNGGVATGNVVTVEKALMGAVVGGKALGEASGNTVTVKANTGAVTGGDGTTTNNNIVNIEGNVTVSGTITGGTAGGTGNTLNVKGTNTASNIGGFQKVKFDASNVASGATMLNLTTGATTLDKSAIDATGSTVNGGITLLHNANGINLTGYTDGVLKSETDATTEKNISAHKTGSNITDIRYEGYQFASATTANISGTDVYGGISKAGNSTHDNAITVNGNYTNVYGGHTSGSNGTAAEKNDSHTNTVDVTGGTYTNVYGGWTNVATGKAVSNTVNVTANATGNLVGGFSASAEASNNKINVTNAALTGSITGGQGATANHNVINLRNATVSGIVTGGTAANGTGNTLAVYYGTGASSSVGDFTGIQNLHFDLENAPTSNANPLLKLTNAAGEKSLSNINLAVHRSGATQKLEKGDSFTLMENTTAGGSIGIGDNVTAQGTDGVSRNYTYDITKDASGKLIATVTKAGLGEQSKSIVETRAGASAFLNDGGDFLAGAGMTAAQKEARAAAMTSGGAYGLWAGMGGGSLRHETGSYVDMKGWNLGVGWARENAVKEGSLTFGPFIEYGRGSYDSYLDDGTHGSGKTSYIGAGVMAKLETAADTWIDSALRIGRTKSDYTGLANYDTTSTYYAMHVGVGKDFRVREGDTVSAYVRYSYAHTAGTSARLSSGETYDFDAVNSHRLRIGTRYTHGETALSQLYAGLAWEYEFDGDAHATSQGDSAPSPSLKGGSALLELGYRFAPKADSRVSYDINLNGWQGKRKGVTGGISVKWAF